MLKEYTYQLAKNSDASSVITLIKSIFDEYHLAFDYPHVTTDLQNIESAYTNGYFGLVIDADENLVGTFGLFPLSESTAEIRKMYLLPGARGKGLGKWMLQFLIDKAKALGYKKIELETSGSFTQAIRLYEKSGFRQMENCNAASACNRAYCLELA